MTNCDTFSFSSFAHHFPPFISRTDIPRFFPWLSQKRLANLASAGQGPPAIKNGRAVIYPTRELLAWLDSRTQERGGRLGNTSTPRSNLGCVENNAMSAAKNRRGRKSKEQEVRERRGL